MPHILTMNNQCLVKTKNKVVVIGSGVGGSASAALLAKSGYDVTLIEQHPFLGGRCATMERNGFQYDFGVHMFSRGDKGTHGQVNRELDGRLEWIKRDPPCRVMGKIEFDFPLDINPLGIQIYLARKLGIKFTNLIGAFRLFRSLMNPGPSEEYDDLLLSEYISRFTSDDNIHLFLNCLCQLYFALSYREASAGEFIWCFSRMFKDASFGYPRGGGRAIPGSFLESLKRNNGNIVYKQQVVNIVVENGIAVGVRASDKLYPADIIISNTGISRTIELAGKENFPEDFASRAEENIYSNAYITVKYALSKPVIPYPVVFYMPDMPGPGVFNYIKDRSVPEDPFLFIPVPSNMDPTLAPSGKQLVIAGTAAPPGASKKLCDAIIDLVDKKINQLFPDIKNAIMWKIYSTADDITGLTNHCSGACIGLGQIPGQVGINRPSHETPIKNLWMVGADVGSRGIGTEMASGSALNLVNIINQKY